MPFPMDDRTRSQRPRHRPGITPAEQNTTETVDLITNRIYGAVSTIRAVHDVVDAVDPSTSDLLHEIIDSLEKQAWMIKSENRKV